MRKIAEDFLILREFIQKLQYSIDVSRMLGTESVSSMYVNLLLVPSEQPS